MYTKEYQVPTYTGEHFCATRTIAKDVCANVLNTFCLNNVTTYAGNCASPHVVQKQATRCLHVSVHTCTYVYRWVGCVADTKHTSILVRAYMYVAMYKHGYVQTWLCVRTHGYMPTWLCAHTVMCRLTLRFG